jgi:hypothetical protein
MHIKAVDFFDVFTTQNKLTNQKQGVEVNKTPSILTQNR